MSIIQVLVPDNGESQQPQQWVLQPSQPVFVKVPPQNAAVSSVAIGSSRVTPRPLLPAPPQPEPTPPPPPPLPSQEMPVSQMLDMDADGLDLEEFRDLVGAFKEKRVSLGLTQTQAGTDLQSASGQAYSQSFVCRLERLDVTLRQAKQVTPMLKKWLAGADQKYCILSASDGRLVPISFSEHVGPHYSTKIRCMSLRNFNHY